MKSVRIPGVFVGLSVVIGLAAPAGANVLCVNPGGTAGCFATIQAAVNAAQFKDVIQVAAGTYHEVVSVPNVWVTIEGAGADKTIVDGTGVAGDAVFQFTNNPNPGPTITLSDMTIRGGHRGIDGGRFLNLTLRKLLVTENGPGAAAGVFNNASQITILNSVISNNTASDGSLAGCDGGNAAGGGIASFCGGGSYTVIDSAIVNNTAGFGAGAAFVNGQQTIINSTISGNHTTLTNSIGGAIMSFSDNFMVSNSTFAGNTTVAGGGTVAVFGPTQMKATIFDGNVGNNCLLGADPTTYASTGYSVSSDASCAPLLNNAADLNSVSAGVQPLESTRHTFVNPLPAGSPALDIVPASLCPAPAADQRGVARAQGPACDSGAYELTVGEELASLAELVSHVGHGQELVFTVRLAQAAYADGRTHIACLTLAALLEELHGMAWRSRLDPPSLDAIVAATTHLRTVLGC